MKVTVDANVLVRGIVQDDPKQAGAAGKMLKEASLVAASLPCLCEFVWDSAPRLPFWRWIDRCRGPRTARYGKYRHELPRRRGRTCTAGSGRRLRRRHHGLRGWMAGRGKPSYLSIDRQSRCCRSEGKPRDSWNEALGWKAFSAQQPQWKVNRPMKSPATGRNYSSVSNLNDSS